MKERPILYSAPMVLAKLAKRKTQTRRVAKFKFFEGQNPNFSGYTPGCYHSDVAASGYVLRSRGGGGCWNDRTEPLKPYALVGDLLWGRETWRQMPCDDCDVENRTCFCRDSIVYRASVTNDLLMAPWKPSIFMPRWASRLLDEVVSVRVERLGDMSDTDAIAEGIIETFGHDVPAAMGHSGPVFKWPGSEKWFTSARAAYFAGWDMINGRASAAKNPWVWVIEFKPVSP